MKKNSKLKPFVFLFLIILIYLTAKSLYRSAFFNKQDRINIVFSEEHPAYYSIGTVDNVNYFVPFFSDLEVVIPGGYGNYRLGALEKLVDLEKNSSLIKRTYSYMTSSFVDYFFYPSKSSDKIKVYFGDKKDSFIIPGSYLIFFGKSNADFFDRLYIFLLFFGKTKGQFKIISSIPFDKEADRTIFSSDKFFEKFRGYFYSTAYRKEMRDVQILYSKSYQTATKISQILEGEGIRVVDLTKITTDNNECLIKEDSQNFSRTAKELASFFNCKLIKEKTEVYDIILQLERGENEWL